MTRMLLIGVLACVLRAEQAPTIVLNQDQQIIHVTVASGKTWRYERDARGRLCAVSIESKQSELARWVCVTAEDGMASQVVGPTGMVDPQGGTIRWDELALVLSVPGKPPTILVDDPRSL